MRKARFVCALSALAAMAASCSYDSVEEAEIRAEYEAKIAALQAMYGCSLDSDCADGTFCFHNKCVIECNTDLPCTGSFVCDEKRGRCVDRSFALSRRRSTENAINQNEEDLLAAQNGSAISSVIGQNDSKGNLIESFSLYESVAPVVAVSKGEKTIKVSFVANKDLGTVNYAVFNTTSETAAPLEIAKMSELKINLDGTEKTAYKYEMEILPELSNLDENAKAEDILIESSAGTFELSLVPLPEMNGTFSGYVHPQKVLSGIELPIRMAIVTEPTNPKSIDEITKAWIYLPSAGTDLFAPENVEIGADKKPVEHWSKLEMSKDNATNCTSGKNCLYAAFSTNNYVAPGSKIITAQHHINRSLRIELSDYDPSVLTFSGGIKDTIAGFYRKNEINESGEVQRTWNKAEMTGSFTISRIDAFDPEKVTVNDHVKANETLRDTTEAPLDVCAQVGDFDPINTLFGYIPSESPEKCAEKSDDCTAEKLAACDVPEGGDEVKPEYCNDEYLAKCTTEVIACHDRVNNYKEYANACKSNAGVEAFKNMADEDIKAFCVKEAAKGLLADNSRLSTILTKVLETGTANEGEGAGINVDQACVAGGQINNFADFTEACSKDSCKLCQERPEYACAADLVARLYLADGDSDDEKADLMNTWLTLIRESYLGQEYNAWSQDTEIREKWLVGATYDGSFASSLMDDFNNGLLADYKKLVLDIQHGVMAKQLNQTSIEMLAQTIESGNQEQVDAINSMRNSVLTELAQTWETVGEDLATNLKRHDVLSQSDMARVTAAGEMRPYLFDLYFAGLMESTINLASDMGSLNASYGSQLTSIISNLDALDRSFESRVFMRDGEVLRNTDMTADTILKLLENKAKRADTLVKEADAKRQSVLNGHQEKLLQNMAMKDNYLTTLENLQTQIINLCGYPNDCVTKEASDEKCKSLTENLRCGFSLPHDTEDYGYLASSKPTTAKVNSIGLSNTDDKGNITTGEGNGNTNDSTITAGSDANTSKAANAIIEYQKALEEYETANVEYKIHAQKGANTISYLDYYRGQIEQWYKKRADLLTEIENKTIDCPASTNTKADFTPTGVDGKCTMGDLLGLLDDNEAAQTQKEIDATKSSLEKQQNNYNSWKTQMGTYVGLQTTAQAMGTAAQITSLVCQTHTDIFERKGTDTLLQTIAANTAKNVAGNAASQGGAAVASTAADAWDWAQVAADGAAIAAETLSNASSLAYETSVDKLDRQTELDIAKIEKTLGEDLQKLSKEYTGIDNAIGDLEDLIDELKEANATAEDRERDLVEYNKLVNDYNNFMLDLVPLAHTVAVKELGMLQAEMKYYEIVQEAQLIESQYNNKLARYDETSNIVYAASSFFDYANDLEIVEMYIDRARDALDDYLTALEYQTVRPFVDLRRSIYTARGTNDLAKILEELNTITSKCGDGTDSTNRVVVSARNQLGILKTDVNELSPEDRFHYILKKGEMPISAQARYSVDESIAEKLKKGNFYSVSFTLGRGFSNLETTCNAKINNIEIRLVSKPGQTISPNGTTPMLSLFYGGQSMLSSCKSDIADITASVGARTSYGVHSTFYTQPFGNGLNATVYNVPEGEEYDYSKLQDATFGSTTVYNSLQNYPMMASYTILIDPNAEANKNIDWNAVADIEILFNYTTGSINPDSKCNYK